MGNQNFLMQPMSTIRATNLMASMKSIPEDGELEECHSHEERDTSSKKKSPELDNTSHGNSPEVDFGSGLEGFVRHSKLPDFDDSVIKRLYANSVKGGAGTDDGD